MVHNERMHNCVCPTCNIGATGNYRVKFGSIYKRFKSYPEAAQFLSGLRFKESEGSLDKRDYQKDQPLAFSSQISKWLTIKKKEVKLTTYRNLSRYIHKALESIGDKNVKYISNGDIQDFLYADETAASSKTRSDIRSCLNQFFTWLEDREGIKKPSLPKIKYELGWRNLTDLTTQRSIIDHLYEIAPEKVAFGVDLLATYPKLRPDDLRRIAEKDCDGQFIIILHPTKKSNARKVIQLLPEHAEQWVQLSKKYPALPGMPFFRHHGETKAAPLNEVYGKDYLYKWWKRACSDLNNEGLDLYGGTRHSTVTAIATMADEASAKKASAHETNKAFARYCQAEDAVAYNMASMVRAKTKCRNGAGAKITTIKRKG